MVRLFPIIRETKKYMSYTEGWCLSQAIEITKEFARGGSEKVTPDYVLEETFKKLKELTKDID